MLHLRRSTPWRVRVLAGWLAAESMVYTVHASGSGNSMSMTVDGECVDTGAQLTLMVTSLQGAIAAAQLEQAISERCAARGHAWACVPACLLGHGLPE